MDVEHLLTLLSGFVIVFIAAGVCQAVCRRGGRPGLTDFQQFLFGTGAVYLCVTVWQVVRFLVDYYVPGSDLQGSGKPVQQSFALFFRIFGPGKPGEAQYPLLNTDLAFVTAMVGAALGGAALLIVLAVLGKKRGMPQTGLFYGYRFPKKTLHEYLRDEIATLRSQVPLWEYLLWWVVRGLLVYGFLKVYPKEGFSYGALQTVTNLAVSFVIPLIRLLFFAKLYLGNISYRVQSLIDIFVVTGTIMGHVFELRAVYGEYDKVLHLVSGGLVVFIGYILIRGARESKNVRPGVVVAASAGFSCVVAILWEVFEFFADFLLPDCSNQGYSCPPSEDFFVLRWMGRGTGDALHRAVLDTNVDLICAMAGLLVCAAVLALVLAVRARRAKTPAPAPAEAETEPAAASR